MLHLAIELAEGNDRYPKWSLGAVITKGGSVFGKGINKKRNDPRFNPNGVGCSEHAEIAALRDARKSDLNNAIIFVARIGRNGELAMARPCNDCREALLDAGIKKVVFTTSTGELEVERI